MMKRLDFFFSVVRKVTPARAFCWLDWRSVEEKQEELYWLVADHGTTPRARACFIQIWSSILYEKKETREQQRAGFVRCCACLLACSKKAMRSSSWKKWQLNEKHIVGENFKWFA